MHYFVMGSQMMDRYRDTMCEHRNWNQLHEDCRTCRECGRIETLVEKVWVRTDDTYRFQETHN